MGTLAAFLRVAKAFLKPFQSHSIKNPPDLDMEKETSFPKFLTRPLESCGSKAMFASILKSVDAILSDCVANISPASNKGME